MKITHIKSPNNLDALEKELTEDTNYNFKGATSALTHLKSALYDWRIENNWNNDRAFVYTLDNKGFIFFTITKNNPIHCTLRHFFVIEYYRGENIGSLLYNHMIAVLEDFGCFRLRMFINPPSINFYKKKGIDKYHGYSKTNMPFYYGDLKGTLLPLPKTQQRYVVGEKKSSKVIDLNL